MDAKVKSYLLSVVVCLLYSFVFSFLSILRHISYQSNAWDLGIFSRALINLMRGRFLLVEFLPYHNPLAFHTQFTLLVFYPIFLLSPRSETLLVLQSFVIGASGFILFKLAREETGSNTVPLVLQVSFYLSPALHGINLFDFHPEVFALPFIFLLLREYDKGNYFKGLIYGLVILLSKEDLSLILIALGLVSIIELVLKVIFWKTKQYLSKSELLPTRNPRKTSFCFKDFIFGTLFVFVGLFYLFISYSYIFPFFGVKSFAYSHRYGRFELNHLLRNLFIDFNKKAVYIFVLLVPVLFMIIFSPRYFMVFAIVSLEFLLSIYPPMYVIGYHYPIPLIPIIYFGALKGSQSIVLTEFTYLKIPTMKNFIALSSRLKGSTFIFLILLASITVSYVSSPIRNVEFPDYHDAILNEILTLIPPNSSVATTNQILPHLIDIKDIHIQINGNENYIIVDLTSPYLYGNVFSPFHTLDEIWKTLENYGILVLIDGILVLKKGVNIRAYKAEELGIEHTLKCEYYIMHDNVIEPILIEDIATLERNFTNTLVLISNYTDESFKIVLRGYLSFPISGEYQFKVPTSDTVEIYIDDKRITHLEIGLFSFRIDKGLHKISIEFEINKNNPLITILWKLPNSNKFRLIEPRYLFNSIK